MSERIALVDVDGVVIDLMGGLKLWHQGQTGEILDFDRPMIHDDLGPVIFPLLERFMNLDDCYKWCDPCLGAVEGLKGLHDRGFTIVFNTAIMKSARRSYVSKYERLEELLQGIPFEYAAVPSAFKWLVQGTIGIDDRADICLDYAQAGTFPILVARRWSFKPDLTLADFHDRLCDLGCDGIIGIDQSELEFVTMPELRGAFPEDRIRESVSDETSAWNGIIQTLDSSEQFGSN